MDGVLFEGSDLVMNCGKFREFGVYTSCAGTFLHDVNTTAGFSGSPMLIKDGSTWHVAGVHLAKTPPVLIQGE